ncbi:hypothetical protein [Halovenus marina]|uniref:hypothetical protein n=1 Tax=Halovenus marina TaxID=3396621 RepID=UPI003F55FFC2
MTDDPLRDAVKRLRSIKEDVERLKSGRRSEGILRIIRQVDEQLGFSDAIDARLQDRLVEAQLGFGDDVTARLQDVIVDEQLGLRDAVAARLQDRLVDEQVGFDDTVTTTVETGGEFVADESVADGDDRVG